MLRCRDSESILQQVFGETNSVLHRGGGPYQAGRWEILHGHQLTAAGEDRNRPLYGKKQKGIRNITWGYCHAYVQPKETSWHLTFDPAQTSLGFLLEFLFLCSNQTSSHTQKFLPCYYHFLLPYVWLTLR